MPDRPDKPADSYPSNPWPLLSAVSVLAVGVGFAALGHWRRAGHRHRLRMQPGHAAPPPFGFRAPQRIKDVGHGVQAPVRRRGSLTPLTRLSSMRVSGPARPSGVTPWAS